MSLIVFAAISFTSLVIVDPKIPIYTPRSQESASILAPSSKDFVSFLAPKPYSSVCTAHASSAILLIPQKL